MKIGKQSVVRLYSWGSSWSGQLGLGSHIQEQYTPHKSIYCWGQSNYGQLGLNDKENRYEPIKNTFFEQFKSIESIGCGGFHSIICVKESNGTYNTYSFGWNDRGQLGRSTSSSVENINPKLIQKLVGKKVTSISCGPDYSIISTDENRVYSFGMNDQGQCGIDVGNNRIIIGEPNEIESLRGVEIKKLKSGWGHTLVLTKQGQLLTWGSNFHGQCGIGSKGPSIIPVSEIKQSSTIIDISCGSCISSAIDDGGSFFIWGSSGDGKLGIPNQKDDIISPHHLNSLPKIKKISFGSDHCLALPTDQPLQVIGWGFGQHGTLGIDKLETFNSPQTITYNFFDDQHFIPNEILQIHSSLDTSFSLVRGINKE
eukprot:gene2603-3227_t